MYARTPTASEQGNPFLAAVASTVDSEVELWPENAAAFRVFAQCSTQWRVSMSGPIGLDYPAVYPLIDRAAASAREWDEMFEDVRVMEREALDELRQAHD